MATVLLGWELGGGLGHAGALLDVARGLAEYGHEPILALKDIVGPLPILKGTPFRVLQAPVWTGEPPPGFLAASYADILAIRGYADADGLAALVAGWQGLIDLTRAALVVGESAPTLLLAAFGATPALSVTNGFHSPPACGPAFPMLGTGAAPIVPADSLLGVVREVQRRRGRPAPETLPGLFAEADQFVRTLPETDAYRSIRPEPADGPLRRRPGPSPPPAEPSYFAYVAADYPGVDLLFPHLAAAGYRGGAFLRNATPALRAAIRGPATEVFESPRPLPETLARTSVIIHHGSLGAAESALAAGRPQLSLCRHLEQELTGRALQGLGVGLSLSGRISVRDVETALARLLGEPAFSERAMALAYAIRAREPGESLTGITACCLRRLDGRRTPSPAPPPLRTIP